MSESTFGTIQAHWLNQSQKGTPSLQLHIATDGRKRFNADLWLTPKALENSMRTLNALGFEGIAEDLEQLHHTTLLVGTPVHLQMEEEVYRGEQRWKIKFVNPVYHSKGKLSSRQAKDLVLEVASGSQEAPSRGQSSFDDGGSDEEHPF